MPNLIKLSFPALVYGLPGTLSLNYSSEFNGVFSEIWPASGVGPAAVLFGIIILTPLILVWRLWPAPDRPVESAGFLVLLLLSGQVIFFDWFHGLLGPVARGYWMFLFVSWAAVRFGRRGVTLVVGITAIQALLGGIQHTGFFANDLETTHLLNFWIILTLSLVGMTTASAIQKREETEQHLRDNIAERKQVEEKLRLQSTALEAAANAIMITDGNGVIQWINPAFTAMTGFVSAEAIGKKVCGATS